MCVTESYISECDNNTGLCVPARALYLNLIGLWVVLVCSVISGLCLYSVYKSCDPWTTGQVTALDQVQCRGTPSLTQPSAAGLG